jgi:hypothetical protein
MAAFFFYPKKHHVVLCVVGAMVQFTDRVGEEMKEDTADIRGGAPSERDIKKIMSNEAVLIESKSFYQGRPCDVFACFIV